MSEFLKSIYNPNITQIVLFNGINYKHLPNEDWFVEGLN